MKIQIMAAMTAVLGMTARAESNVTVYVENFELYTLRHTCLTRWAPHMDPWTLAYLAGHRDMNITKRYIHPQTQTIREAMERAGVARGGHTSGHTVAPRANSPTAQPAVLN